jgi:hypothetical protein
MRPNLEFDRTREFPHDPTYVAEFDDGRVIRMSCYCRDGKLDWERGERLVQFVLENSARFRNDRALPARCWFERNGQRIDRPREKND